MTKVLFSVLVFGHAYWLPLQKKNEGAPKGLAPALIVALRGSFQGAFQGPWLRFSLKPQLGLQLELRPQPVTVTTALPFPCFIS